MLSDQDKEIISNLNKGSKPAFNKVYNQYINRLSFFIFKYIKDKELTEEILQELFINLWQSRNKLTNIDNLTNYLYTSAKNLMVNKLKNLVTRKLHESKYLSYQQIIDNEEDTHEKNNLDQFILLSKAIDSLPEKCRTIFELSKYEGLTYNEIAKHLDISVKTVENQIGTAFKKIKEFFQQNNIKG